MSNINYNIWGAPDTWTHWSASTTPTTETLYGEYRQGAASWDDADFEDYPYFKIGNYVNLRNLKVNGVIDINAPLDSSLSYVAIDNPDLPQSNRYIFNSVHHGIDDYIAVSKDTIVPYSMCYYYRNDNAVEAPSRLGNIYGFDGFPNNVQTLGYGKMQRFSPLADYDTTYTNVNGDYNPILRLAPVTDFGVKSVILEINVGYYINSAEMATSTLKSYLNHEEQWIQDHPAVMIYGVPYFRNNTDGSYTTGISNKSMRFTGVCPIFYTPYRDRTNSYDIYNYLTTFNYGGLSGCFPIFGAIIRDSFSISPSVAVSRIPDDSMSKTNLSRYAVFYGADRAEIHYTGTELSGSLYGTIDLSEEENIEYIMKGAAAYGLFFCQAIGTLGSPGRDTGDSERWIDPEMYCGTISDRGYTNGDYTQGEGNKHQKQYVMKSSTESPYDPDIPPQPKNIYDHQTVFNHIGELAALTKRYVMSGDMVEILGQMLYDVGYTISSGDTDFSEYDSKILDTFLTNNPIDAIISLRRYPMSIPHSETLSNVLLGKYDTMLSTYTTSAAALTYLFQLRDPILPRFGDSFLDYEPYTHFELYVPFCGTVALEPADILNRSLSVQLLVDFTTGTCTAFIMSDLLCIKTVEGNIAIDIPVTGIQSVTAASQLNNAIVSRKQAQVNTVTAGLSLISPGGIGNPFKAVGNLINAGEQLNKAEYDLQHQNVPPHVIGAASPVAGWAIDLQCRLIIYYPDGDIIRRENGIPVWNTLELARYGKTAGFATVEPVDQLSDYAPGLIVATDVDLSGIECTEEERELIVSALSEGCYFPTVT